MNSTVKLGIGVTGGYLLGRTKKLKLAIGLGTYLVGRKFEMSPTRLALQGFEQLRQTPEFAEVLDRVRTDVTGAGRKALEQAVTARMEGMTDSLRQRNSQLADGAKAAGEKAGKADSASGGKARRGAEARQDEDERPRDDDRDLDERDELDERDDVEGRDEDLEADEPRDEADEDQLDEDEELDDEPDEADEDVEPRDEVDEDEELDDEVDEPRDDAEADDHPYPDNGGSRSRGGSRGGSRRTTASARR